MADSLVIVESAGKIQTIKRYLGKDYTVMACVGHVRDLHKSGRIRYSRQSPPTKLERMGVDPDHNWQADYRIQENKTSVVKKLREAGKKASKIYLATDLDREGEAIAWHLREVIGGDDEKFERVVFSEITENAIKEAFQHPLKIDMDRVNAQQARRFLDRVIGFELTPLLYQKVANGLSAGRVQSVAVRMLVEREREIRAHVPREYWEATADLSLKEISGSSGSDGSVPFSVEKYKGEKYEPSNEGEATSTLEELEGQSFSVASHTSKVNSNRPSAPFITTTMQRDASTRIGFPVGKTMRVAQRLYEAGLITYMRTDSVSVSEDAVASARSFISQKLRNEIDQSGSNRYLPAKPNVYSNRSSSQEAHEAIRPTDVNLQKVATGHFKTAVDQKDASALYELIWQRFVASQMTQSKTRSSNTIVKAGEFELRRTVSERIFDGYQRIYPPRKLPEAPNLIEFKEGQELHCVKTEKFQKFTSAPPRYNEASLIRELEKEGIGRPSTYSAIISTIQDRGYVKLVNKRFFTERIGEVVTDRLSESFETLMDYNFTARMETDLDEIAQGGKPYTDVLDTFYGDFSDRLEIARDPSSGLRKVQPAETGVKCPDCDRSMLLRIASTGLFLACPGFMERGESQCKKTMSLTPDADVEALSDSDDDKDQAQHLLSRRKCPKCSSPMDAKLIDSERKIHICFNFPDCQGHEIEHGKFRIKGYEGDVVECNKCGSDMHLTSGRFGKYFACTGDGCKNTRKLQRDGSVAPPREDPIKTNLPVEERDDVYLLRDGVRGLFLGASKYPKVRKMRAVRVSELKAYSNELHPKFHYLLLAPLKDQEGGDYFLRYSTKTQQQYVAGEKAGKRTGWVAFHRDGKWQEQQLTRK